MGDKQPDNVNDWIDRGAGEDFMTPLHYAAQSCNNNNPTQTPNQSSGNEEGEVIVVDPMLAADCVSFLLLEMNASPCILDARMRPPYFCATNDKVRTAFRRARATLGEDIWSWDEIAKVDSPLTNDDIQSKKEKDAEKKRKKRARQKEKKAKEKAHVKDMELQKQQEEERRKKEEEAKRIRDQLQPKSSTRSGGVCDF